MIVVGRDTGAVSWKIAAMKLWLAWLVVATSCATPNPRSCTDGLCNDQSYPFCDTDGSLEGSPQTCIAVTCSAGGTAACRGSTALVCNAAGNDYDLVECPRGCDAERGCFECAEDDQCPANKPVCDASGSCRTCAFDDECAGRVCDAGMCVAESGVLYAATGGAENGGCLQSAPCSVSRALSIATSAPALRLVRMLPGAYAQGLVLDAATSAPLRIVATGASIAAMIGIKVSNGASAVIRGLSITGLDRGVTCGAGGQTRSSLLLEDVSISAGDVFTNIVIVENCTVTHRRGVIDTKGSNGSAISLSDGGSFVGDRLFVRGQNQPGVGAFATNVNLRLTNSILERITLLLVTSDLSPPGSSLMLGNNTLIGTSPDCASRNNRTVVYDNNIMLGENTTNVVTGNGCTLSNNVLHPQAMSYPGNILANPQLEDITAGNYRPKATSPAIDAARPTGNFASVTSDYEGTERPQGVANDIGAFERKP